MINLNGTENDSTNKPKLTLIQKANQYFNLAFYIYFFNSLLMDIVMASLVNLFFMGMKNISAVLHHVLSLTFLLIFMWLVYKTISIMVNYELKKLDKVDSVHVKTKFKKWLFLRVPIKETAKLLPRFIPEAYMVHDILLCVFLVTFNGYSTVQIVSLIILKLYLLVNLCYKPLKETLEQVMLMGNEIFFLSMLGIFLILDFKSGTISVSELRNKYGKTIIIFYIILLAFNCVIGIISTY